MAQSTLLVQTTASMPLVPIPLSYHPYVRGSVHGALRILDLNVCRPPLPTYEHTFKYLFWVFVGYRYLLMSTRLNTCSGYLQAMLTSIYFMCTRLILDLGVCRPRLPAYTS